MVLQSYHTRLKDALTPLQEPALVVCLSLEIYSKDKFKVSVYDLKRDI